jgi:hypothetical protein
MSSAGGAPLSEPSQVTIEPTSRVSSTQKAVRVDTASQVGAQLALDVARHPAITSGASLPVQATSCLFEQAKELLAVFRW